MPEKTDFKYSNKNPNEGDEEDDKLSIIKSVLAWFGSIITVFCLLGLIIYVVQRDSGMEKPFLKNYRSI